MQCLESSFILLGVYDYKIKIYPSNKIENIFALKINVFLDILQEL